MYILSSKCRNSTGSSAMLITSSNVQRIIYWETVAKTILKLKNSSAKYHRVQGGVMIFPYVPDHILCSLHLSSVACCLQLFVWLDLLLLLVVLPSLPHLDGADSAPQKKRARVKRPRGGKHHYPNEGRKVTRPNRRMRSRDRHINWAESTFS